MLVFFNYYRHNILFILIFLQVTINAIDGFNFQASSWSELSDGLEQILQIIMPITFNLNFVRSFNKFSKFHSYIICPLQFFEIKCYLVSTRICAPQKFIHCFIFGLQSKKKEIDQQNIFMLRNFR